MAQELTQKQALQQLQTYPHRQTMSIEQPFVYTQKHLLCSLQKHLKHYLQIYALKLPFYFEKQG